MKKLNRFKNAFLLMLIATLLIMPANAAKISTDTSNDSTAINPLDASTGSAAINIDGYSNDWSDKPFAWEYNWNNPQISGEDGYTTNSRHKISLYRDDSYVYLHVVMAKNYYNSLVGDDYEFTCDGNKTQFRITTSDGKSISKQSFGAGIHSVEVRHGDGSVSGQVAAGSAGMLTRQADGTNDELEIKIPIEDFHYQNSNISNDSIKLISFFTPNLMKYGDSVTCTGTSSAPFVGISLCIASVGVGSGIMYRKRKKKSC